MVFMVIQLQFVSQRHISFIESGRSIPSRPTFDEDCGSIGCTAAGTKHVVADAGYAPVYSDAAWDSLQMQSVTKALKRILRQHEPFPALVMDRYWNVLLTNESAPRFFNCFIDMSKRKGPRNMLHLMFDPASAGVHR
jgi:MmyB-like transcription regulator ligand binding domain